jgi:hypothetical protein
MNENLRTLAMSVLTKEIFQDFATAIFKMEYSVARKIVDVNLDDARDIVLETVYEATCDFVLFDHYRKSMDLVTLLIEVEHEEL